MYSRSCNITEPRAVLWFTSPPKKQNKTKRSGKRALKDSTSFYPICFFVKAVLIKSDFDELFLFICIQI